MKIDKLLRLEAAAAGRGKNKPWKYDMQVADGQPDYPYIFVEIDEIPDGISTLFEADWGTEEDAALVVALRNHAKALLKLAAAVRNNHDADWDFPESVIKALHDLTEVPE